MLRQENQLSPRARRLAYEAQQDSQKESGKPSIYISSVKKDFMCLCITVCMCTMYMPSAEKDHGSPGAGVTDDFELFRLCAGNQTQAFCKRSKWS